MKISLVMGLFYFLFGCLSPCFGKHLDFKYVIEHGTLWKRYLPNQIILKSFQEEIKISEQIALPLKIEVSPYGKGMMEIGNILLHIYIMNLDTTLYYESDMLIVDFVDINKDGIKEMLIHGLVNCTGERCEAIFERESVLFIYRYDVAKKKFILNYKQASFDLEKEFGDISWMDRYDSQPKYDYLKKIDREWDTKNGDGREKDFRFNLLKKQKIEELKIKKEKEKLFKNKREKKCSEAILNIN